MLSSVDLSSSPSFCESDVVGEYFHFIREKILKKEEGLRWAQATELEEKEGRETRT